MTTLPPEHPRDRAWRLREHANALWEMGRFPEARRAAQESLTIEPASARGLCALAQAQSGMGLTDAALASADLACAADPSDPTCHRLRSIYLSRCGEHALAVAAAREAVRLSPEADMTLAVLSDALEGAGELDEALGIALRMRELAPESVRACERCGNIAGLRGRYAEAEGYFRAGLALDPTHNVCLPNLAWAVLYQGRPGEAIPYLTDALRHHPAGAHVSWIDNLLLVSILAHLGDYPDDSFPVEDVPEEERRRRWDALPDAVRRRYEDRVRHWYRTRKDSR